MRGLPAQQGVGDTLLADGYALCKATMWRWCGGLCDMMRGMAACTATVACGGDRGAAAGGGWNGCRLCVCYAVCGLTLVCFDGLDTCLSRWL